MCWVCITWGNLRLSEILVCLFILPFHEGGQLDQLLTKAKISQNTVA